MAQDYSYAWASEGGDRGTLAGRALDFENFGKIGLFF